MAKCKPSTLEMQMQTRARSRTGGHAKKKQRKQKKQNKTQGGLCAEEPLGARSSAGVDDGIAGAVCAWACVLLCVPGQDRTYKPVECALVGVCWRRYDEP